jgi:hypothetical protein
MRRDQEVAPASHFGMQARHADGEVPKMPSILAAISGPGQLDLYETSLQNLQNSSVIQRAVTGLVSGVAHSLPMNGNFETGAIGEVPDYWAKLGGENENGIVEYCAPGQLSAAEKHGGAQSVLLSGTSCLVSGLDGSGCFDVRAGNTYTLKFWAKNSASAVSTLFTIFAVYKAESSTSSRHELLTNANHFQKKFDVQPSGNWEELTQHFTAEENSGKVRFIVGSWNSGGTVYVDDISLTLACPTSVTVDGAQDVTSSSMGAFTQVDHSKFGLPVYKNTHNQFLFYWEDFGRWIVGTDYHSPQTTGLLQSEQQSLAECPQTTDGSWYVWDGSFWQRRAVTVKLH